MPFLLEDIFLFSLPSEKVYVVSRLDKKPFSYALKRDFLKTVFCLQGINYGKLFSKFRVGELPISYLSIFLKYILIRSWGCVFLV